MTQVRESIQLDEISPNAIRENLLNDKKIFWGEWKIFAGSDKKFYDSSPFTLESRTWVVSPQGDLLEFLGSPDEICDAIYQKISSSM